MLCSLALFTATHSMNTVSALEFGSSYCTMTWNTVHPQFTWSRVIVPSPPLNPSLTPGVLVWRRKEVGVTFKSSCERFFQVASRRALDIEGLSPRALVAEMLVLQSRLYRQSLDLRKTATARLRFVHTYCCHLVPPGHVGQWHSGRSSTDPDFLWDDGRSSSPAEAEPRPK